MTPEKPRKLGLFCPIKKELAHAQAPVTNKVAGARYARHRAKPDDHNLVFRSIRAVFWLRFVEAA